MPGCGTLPARLPPTDPPLSRQAVWVRHALVPSLRALPGVEAALEAGCLVADVGCGMGKALMAVAQAFPASTCHGYDISEDALK